nr:hypothetical protein [Tanacetum cinerariifolium]
MNRELCQVGLGTQHMGLLGKRYGYCSGALGVYGKGCGEEWVLGGKSGWEVVRVWQEGPLGFLGLVILVLVINVL